MSSSNICYCFLLCLTSKVDLTSFIYIIDTSGILIYFLYRHSCPFSVGFPAFFLLNEQEVSLCMYRPIIDTPHNRLKFILKGHSYFYTSHTTYSKNIKCQKWVVMGFNGFHIKWIFHSREKLKNVLVRKPGRKSYYFSPILSWN